MKTLHRNDLIIAALFLVVALAMRVPFRSALAYHWDSAQFALAVEHDDMRVGLPHVPGYFLYVLIGRAVNWFVGDPHAALVWMSVVAGAALVALGYLLGTAMFGRGCGVATAVILATSPLCWFQSEVALTPIVDSALVVVMVLMGWWAIRSDGQWGYVIGVSVLFGMVAGVRQQSGATLLPVWSYALWRATAGKRWRLAIAAIVFGLVCVSWFVPMIESAGGWTGYRELLAKHARIDSPLTIWRGGARAAVDSVLFIVAACWTGLLAAGLLALARFALWCVRESPSSRAAGLAEYRDQWTLLVLWVVPMIGFGAVLMYTSMPGHIMGYFPALAIVAGLGVAKVLEGRRRLAWSATLTLIGSLNAAVFLLPANWTKSMPTRLPVTAQEIREHDRQLALWMAALQARFSPAEVMLCHGRQYYLWGVRHFQYHLPGYLNCYLRHDRALAPPFDRQLWYVQGRQMEFADTFDPKGRKLLVLVVSPEDTVEKYSEFLDLSRLQVIKVPGTASIYVLPAAEARPKDSG